MDNNKSCHVIKCVCNTGLPKALCVLFSNLPCKTKDEYVSDYINWNDVK